MLNQYSVSKDFDWDTNNEIGATFYCITCVCVQWWFQQRLSQLLLKQAPIGRRFQSSIKKKVKYKDKHL